MMKQELERIDYGGHPKYSHAGAFGSALFPGRSARFDSSSKQQGFSLLDLNPHKGSLGLNLQVGADNLLLFCCCDSFLPDTATCSFFL
jgi:hypothetical protein